MLKQTLALVLCVAIATAGCASASSGQAPATAPVPAKTDTATMADYVQRLPAGSRVRVDRTSGHSVKGTLMRASADAITVQANTRVPEAPIEIPIGEVTRVALDRGSSTAKAVGIGVAVGVGTFFGILAILAASFED
jgi:hypothetical protein